MARIASTAGEIALYSSAPYMRTNFYARGTNLVRIHISFLLLFETDVTLRIA